MWFSPIQALYFSSAIFMCVRSELAEGSFLVSQSIRGVDRFRPFFTLGVSRALGKLNNSNFGIDVLHWKCIDKKCPDLKKGQVVASSLLGGPGDGGAEYLFTYRVKFNGERVNINVIGLLKQRLLYKMISTGLLQECIMDAAERWTTQRDFVANTTRGLIYGPIMIASALDVVQNISGLNCYDWDFSEIFDYLWGNIVQRIVDDEESKDIIQKGYGQQCDPPLLSYTIYIQSPAASTDAAIAKNAEKIKQSIDSAIRTGQFSIRLIKAMEFYSLFMDSSVLIAVEMPMYSLRYVTVESPALMATQLPLVQQEHVVNDAAASSASKAGSFSPTIEQKGPVKRRNNPSKEKLINRMKRRRNRSGSKHR